MLAVGSFFLCYTGVYMSKKSTSKSKPSISADAVCRLPDTHCTDEERSSVAPARMSDITWRIFRIMAEFVEGFQFLSQFSREITIYGSARVAPTDRWYKEARKLGAMLAKAGFTVITGGGPGIMEAANRGAFEAGGQSVGINISLPTEQRTNKYVKESRGFHYFFTRKVMLAASAQGYIYFPGGYGTLDELCEMLTLIQTRKAARVAVVLVGKSHWQPFVDWLKSEVWHHDAAIDREDLALFTLVDSAEEAFAAVKDSKERTIF